MHRHFLFVSLGNLALYKQVWEDNPWGGREDWKARKAVDGIYNNRSAAGGQCVISQNYKKTAMWRVNLGDVVSISHINIYYRTDNFQSTTYLNYRYINNYRDQCEGKTVKVIAITNFFCKAFKSDLFFRY